MNILTRWHESLDLLLSRQLFTFIKDTFFAIARTYWLTIKYWWWLYVPLLVIESAIWFLPFGYEELFFNRFFKLALFAGRLFIYFIMIVAAQAPDRKVTFDYFRRRLSFFSPIFFTLVIAYWFLAVLWMWACRLLSLAQASEPLHYFLRILVIINQYILLYPTEIFASALFVFFVCWVIRDYFNGMQVAFSRAVHMLIYTYLIGVIMNVGMWFAFKVLTHGTVMMCSYCPSIAYLCLLDYELLVAPIPVAAFATLFAWHSSYKAELYQ